MTRAHSATAAAADLRHSELRKVDSFPSNPNPCRQSCPCFDCGQEGGLCSAIRIASAVESSAEAIVVVDVLIIPFSTWSSLV